jgi:mannose-6-phosphate isomerase-like protein (cupin superfamily)
MTPSTKENLMSHRHRQSPRSRSFQVAVRGALAVLLGASCATGYAQAASAERPVTWTAEDASIKWAPCPSFLPAGCGLAVLHGDPSKDNVDVFLKLTAKSVLPPHWHTSAERMILVAGELHVTYDGHKPAILRSGTYAYGPARLPHKGVCASDVPCVLFIAFESPLDAVPLANPAK